jgi:hypothetical protein
MFSITPKGRNKSAQGNALGSPFIALISHASPWKTPMARSRRDGFRIKDAMLAIAATAIGFAWVQAQWDTIQLFAGQYADQPRETRWILGDRPFYQMTRVFTKDVLYVATAMACPWMVLMLRSRRGGLRGRFWRARRPGAIACLAGTGVLIFELVRQAIWPVAGVHQILYVTTDRPQVRIWGWGFFDDLLSPAMRDPLRTMLIWMPRHTGIVVGGAWLALILAGFWRPERSWTDRAGRLIGAFWIIAACHFCLLPL